MERVASLWIGDELSILERLCLKSFSDLGQTPILYSYAPIKHAPRYVEMRDAEEILPLSETGGVLRDPVFNSPAVHADLFRLHLCRKTDHIWVDCDAYALKPFRTNDGYLLCGLREGQRRVFNGVFRVPSESPALDQWINMTRQKPCVPPWWERRTQREFRQLFGKKAGIRALPLGVIGPLAAYHFLNESGEAAHIQPEREYYALPFSTRRSWLDPDIGVLDEWEWKTRTSIHLFSSVFRGLIRRSGGRIPPSSLIGLLLSKHEL